LKNTKIDLLQQRYIERPKNLSLKLFSSMNILRITVATSNYAKKVVRLSEQLEFPAKQDYIADIDIELCNDFLKSLVSD
jgi:hypothetical protein